MTVLGVFGGRGTTAFDRPTTATSSSSQTSASSAASVSYETARNQLRASAAALIASFLDLSSETSPVYSSSIRTAPLVHASVRGSASRIAPVGGSASRLQTTEPINTQTSTIRRSTSPIGLDLSGSAVSTLRSSALSLDVSSPPAPSRLNSATLGLDTTSTDAASVLYSGVLGLDLTSPNAPSTLQSSAALGIDVSSPQAASRVYSSALGLDLTSPDAPSVFRSSAALGLDVTSPQSASTIASTAEMNTGQASSLSATTLNFTGAGQASTSQGTLSGTFAGTGAAAGATSLNVVLTRNTAALNGFLPSSVRFEVRDQADTVLFSYNGNLLADQSVYLGDDIGLSISFSAGRLTSGQSASTAITWSPITVDTNAAFNAAVGSRPKFDGGAQATAGSFSVNGTAITVNANDTINTVLARINASGAGVTGAVAGDRITLTSNGNSEDAITFGADTSGFLSAARLTSATTQVGNVRDDQQVLSKTTQFGGVTNGTFTVNGVSISVNRATDSLTSIINRIDASAAGVTATYDSATDKVVLTSSTNSEDVITVAGDTSGFVAAANLATANTVRGHVAEDATALQNLARFAGVTSGSFIVDGQTISVGPSDTIQSIVSRINSSGARVTASFDAATNKLGLTTTFNSEDDVAVGNDTSGFLAAAGIAAASSVRGNIRDDEQTLNKTSQFGGVSSGSFTINGVTIAVDRAADSLNSIIARINGAGAGVTAAFDTNTDSLVLTGTANSEDLIAVGNDTTGFLAAAHLSTENTVRGHLPEDGVALANLSQFQSVSDGSFTIDGQTIAVNVATDTVQSLVDRINNSGARVTATYDAATDRVKLQDAFNSEDNVSIGGDTSGFLSAAGLTSANTQKGSIRDDVQVLSKTSQFGAVTSGSFDINGATIVVDANTDTVESIVGKINAANAGVTAAYNASSDQIELVGANDSEDLVALSNDSTGFLSATGLTSMNTLRGNLPDDQQVLAKTSQFGNVRSGSFMVNGATIAVDAANDTLNSVIDRINASNAGVTARYDVPTDRVVLTANAADEELITVGSDDTGFLSATGLATANTSRGNIPDDQQILSKTTQFAGVTDGQLTVNGAAISVDASRDSLQAVIDRINAAGAGVTASYDRTTDSLVFTPDVDGETLALEGDTTGFLAAAHVTSGTVGTSFNPDARFDGVGADSPNFDPPRFAHEGSFTVNGVTINVSNWDTVNSVLARITASAADAIATYDIATKQVMVISRHPSATEIALGNDTSGFLEAVKLDQAQSTAGTDQVSALDTTLGSMSEYSGLRAGTITVNGTNVAVDPSHSTLRDVANALNHVAGVSATLDNATGSLTLASTSGATPIQISDTSGLLGKLGIVAGTYAARGGRGPAVQTQTGTQTKSNASAVAASVAEAARNVNDALTLLTAKGGVDAKTRHDMETSIRSVVSAMTVAGVDGLSAQSGPQGLRLVADRGDLERSIIKNASSITDLIAEGSDLGTALGAMLDKFAPDSTAARSGAARRLTRSDLETKVTTDALGQDLGLRLLLLRSTLRLDAADVNNRTAAAKAYADTESAFTKLRGG